jgi:hypothetical protein
MTDFMPFDCAHFGAGIFEDGICAGDLCADCTVCCP